MARVGGMPSMRNQCRRPFSGLVAVVAALAPLGLAACSNSTSGTPTTAKAPSATSKATTTKAPSTICTIVPPSEIKATLGLDVYEPQYINNPGATTCAYTGKPVKNTTFIVFKAGVNASEASVQKSTVQSQYAVSDVSGPGFLAYYYSDASKFGEVTALVTVINEYEVVITAPAKVDQLESLAKQIYASLAAAGHPNPTASTTTTVTTAAG